ncbi:MAG: hypothetical protein V4640_16050 [Verrucomicrobiota bacterium]
MMKSKDPTSSVRIAAPARRSLFVTILGCFVILGSALASIISVLTGMMFLVGSYGTSSGMTLEGIIILLGPPVTLVAGVALIRRRRWAYVYLLLLLVSVLAYNGDQLGRGPTPQSTRVSPSGVPTTTLASGGRGSVPVIAGCVALLAALLVRNVRAEFGLIPMKTCETADSSNDAVKWRVGHRGRDSMYYEELHGGIWERIDIDGEMLMGRAHHVIYFATAPAWNAYPAWAQGRRDEIISRIKSQFREPDYEYLGDIA